MKQFLILCAVCLGIFAMVGAELTQAQTPAAVQPEKGWDFLSCTFVPGVPPTEDVYDVYGVKIGLPMGFGDRSIVCGTELSVIGSTTPTVSGVQGAILFNDAQTVDGLQATFIYNFSKVVNGLQFGIVNVAQDKAFQLGILNFIKNSPVPFLPFINCRF